MVKRKNVAIKKEASKAAKAHKLLIFPLMLVLACCVFTFIQGPSLLSSLGATLFSPSFGAILITPPLPIVLVTVFTCLAIYLVFTNRRVGQFVTVATWLFAVIALCFLLVAIPGIGQMCGGLSCATTNTYSLGVLLLLNPFADFLWNVLAIVGIVLLVRRMRQ